MDEIKTLATKVLNQLEVLNYSTVSMKNFRLALSSIATWFKKEANSVFSDSAYHQYTQYLESLKLAGRDKGWINTKLRCVEQLRNYYYTGNINFNYDKCGNLKFTPSNQSLITISTILTSLDLAERTKRTRSTYLRKFYCYIEEQGLSEIDITQELLYSYVKKSAKDNPASVCNVSSAIKNIINYLVEKQIISQEIDLKFIVPKKQCVKILPIYTEQEINSILQSINRSTAIGKRNYALILLGISTGIRARDIQGLNLSDINWTRQEIAIVQSKTNSSHHAPLSGQVCNALAEYILHGRPKTKENYVFIRSRAPYTRMSVSTSCLNTIIDRQCIIAGVEKKQGRSFHSLRRTFGTWLAKEEIMLPTISQMLGHRTIDSSKPYLSFNDTALSKCALDFSDVPISEGVYCEFK